MTNKEIIAIAMAMEDEKFYNIIEALKLEDEEGYPLYSVEEVAKMYETEIEVVQYIDRAENDDC